MASRVAFGSILASSALLLGACIITSSDSDDDDDSQTTTTTATTVPDGGSGGGAIVGGAGGAGGELLVGGGGSGGTAPTCVPEAGSGMTVDACDDMYITPPPEGAAMLCGVEFDQPPPGYLVCQRGFEIYTAGQAEDLQICLADIGVAEACEEEPVLVCIEGMYLDACERQSIIELCDGFATDCAPDPFDAAQCKVDLNPFSEGGLIELTDCINAADPELSCQEAYDQCFYDVVTSA